MIGLLPWTCVLTGDSDAHSSWGSCVRPPGREGSWFNWCFHSLTHSFIHFRLEEGSCSYLGMAGASDRLQYPGAGQTERKNDRPLPVQDWERPRLASCSAACPRGGPGLPPGSNPGSQPWHHWHCGFDNLLWGGCPVHCCDNQKYSLRDKNHTVPGFENCWS